MPTELTMPTELLARRYRRWLFAYPRSYRRARGEEIVGTLLDCAPPGRTSPTIGERLDLIRCGARARLGRPTSRLIVVPALVLALVGALMVGEFAAWASWQAAPPLPSDATLLAVSTNALSTSTISAPTRGPREGFVTGYNSAQGHDVLWGGEEYYWGYAEIDAAAHHWDIQRQTRIVRDRLRATGWEVSAIRLNEPTTWPGAKFTARRGDLVLTFTHDTRVDMTYTRARPWWVLPTTGVGLIVGALLGWLLAGWLSRRTEGRSVVLRLGVGLVATVALTLQLPAILGSSIDPLWMLYAAARGGDWDGYGPLVPPGFGYAFLFSRPTAIFGALAALFAVALALLPRVGRARPKTTGAEPAT